MVTLRWSRAKASSVTPKLRWARVIAQGAGTTPKLRWSRVVAQGTAPLVLQPLADQSVEALSSVVLQAVVGATSPTPDGYQWRQISGPTASYVDGGSSISFVAPPSMGGTPLVFGVVGTLGGVLSSEVAATVSVVPHLFWTATAGGWVALMRQAAA